ncbi:MAG: hypothetical protein JWN15_2933 [Firmicutes bacterium]|nr:hypothetical protein [Bacillota bacterium]
MLLTFFDLSEVRWTLRKNGSGLREQVLPFPDIYFAADFADYADSDPKAGANNIFHMPESA